MHRVHAPFFLLCLICALMIAWGTHMNLSIIKEKDRLERMELDHFQKWIQSYSALAPVRKQWDAAYPPGTDIKDLLTLYRKFNFESAGLIATADTMQLGRITPLQENNRYLGLTEACVITGNEGNKGFVVSAPDYGKLIQGIQALSQRREIRFTGITIDRAKNRPHAVLRDMCLLVRDDEDASQPGVKP